MSTLCEHRAFFEEGITFYKSAQVLQLPKNRDDDIDLFSPIIFLFRHSAELLFKAIIIKKMLEWGYTDWQAKKIPSNNRRLLSTHSILELYNAWRELAEINKESLTDKTLLEEYVNSIERYDSDSTFFRYPIDKSGNRNRKAMTEDLDEELLNSLPCSLGAIVCANGINNFSCLHREQCMEYLEQDMERLLEMLIDIYETE